MNSILLVKKFWGLVEMMSELVNAGFSLSKWQAVKMIFFAPCVEKENCSNNTWLFFDCFKICLRNCLTPIRFIAATEIRVRLNLPPMSFSFYPHIAKIII